MVLRGSLDVGSIHGRVSATGIMGFEKAVGVAVEVEARGVAM